MAEADYRTLSLWHATVDDAFEPRAPLEGEREVDVAIVGAGYSGLWTAYYLARLDPGLRIAIVEAEVAGFGASGRNGGWATGGLSGVEGLIARPEQRADGIALQRAVFDAVDQVGRVAEAEGIDCDYKKGGSIHVATSARQLEAARAHMRHLAEWGIGDEDYRWLDARDCDRHVQIGILSL